MASLSAPLGPITQAVLAAAPGAVKVNKKAKDGPRIVTPEGSLVGDVATARHTAKLAGLYPTPVFVASETEQWVDVAVALLATGTDDATLAGINTALTERTYLVGFSLSFADIALAFAIRCVRLPSPAASPTASPRPAAPPLLPQPPTPAFHDGCALCPRALLHPPLALVPLPRRTPVRRANQQGHCTTILTPHPATMTPEEKAALGRARTAAARAKAKAEAAAKGATKAGAGTNSKLARGATNAVLRPLPGAVAGQVVTRFPPEPSGYLHIGHAKALVVNDAYARKYDGKLLVRFDDTNPSKETAEFSEAILKDIASLGIKVDFMSHTSDHFDVIIEYAKALIADGHAYMDDTPVEEMRRQRGEGIDSPYCTVDADTNAARFAELLAGTSPQWCLRANMRNMKNNNKCMRDPVLFRSNFTPHVRTGTKYKAYPTYDLACPIVDSIEGVSHAMRTTEYRDREDQYKWLIKAMKLRPVHVVEYSRLNFQYTLLSKRKLQWFVDQGLVESWFDPRFPTVQGMLRRGLTVEALKTFMIQQGASKRNVDMEWDKFWVQNRRALDPISPRYIAVATETAVPLTLIGGDGVPTGIEARSVPAFPKLPDGVQKVATYSNRILIEGDDANACELEEEFTLRNWGNAIVKRVVKDGDRVTAVEAVLNLAGDPRKTKRKLTWVADTEDTTPAAIVEFDFLIAKKHLTEEEESHFQDFLTPVTKVETAATGEACLRTLKEGDFVQLERRGFFRVDKPFRGPDQPVVLFTIPDGKQKAMSTLSTSLSHR